MRTAPSSAASATAVDWRYYRNPTNGFSIRYPPGLRRLAGTPELPGDRLFRSPDGRIMARAYSGPALARTTSELRRRLIKERYRGAHLELASETRDNLILGGTIGGEAFREIAVFSCDRRHVQGLALVFPAAETDRHAPLFEVMSRSLASVRPSSFRCRTRGTVAVE